MVAFHFYRAEKGSGAGWDCGQCRRQGLERRRRCGFLPESERGPTKVVWARAKVATDECPKSAVTAGSLELLEKWAVWKLSGSTGLGDVAAREAEGFLVLEEESRVSEV